MAATTTTAVVTTVGLALPLSLLASPRLPLLLLVTRLSLLLLLLLAVGAPSAVRGRRRWRGRACCCCKPCRRGSCCPPRIVRAGLWMWGCVQGKRSGQGMKRTSFACGFRHS